MVSDKSIIYDKIYIFILATQSGSGLQTGGAVLPRKRRRTDLGPEVEGALNGAHIIISSDVSTLESPNVNIPDSMMEELQI